MIKKANKSKNVQIERNMIFVGTIYDTFEALEETLNKLDLTDAEFLLKLAKKSFANEVFNCAKENNIYVHSDKIDEKRISLN